MVGSEVAVLLHKVEHDVAALKRVLRINKRIIKGGGLKHTHEDSGILGGQVLRLAVEIGLAGGLDTEGVGTEIHSVGILREDFLLSEEIFELVSGDPLLALHDEHLQTRYVAQKASGIFAAGAEEVLGQLLGDGGGTTGIAVEDILLGDGSESGVVDAVMRIETLVLGIDESFPEHGVHLFVCNGRTVFAEELTNGLAVGAIDDGGLGGTLVLNSGHRGRLAEKPKEIHVDGDEIEKEQHNKRYEC